MGEGGGSWAVVEKKKPMSCQNFPFHHPLVLYSNLNEYVIESFEQELNTNMHQFLHLSMQIFNPKPTVLISLEMSGNWLWYSTNILDGWKLEFTGIKFATFGFSGKISDY